ncbi:hypothetical protein OSC52_00260 [Clostridium pasteurianum]|nr:hypothetical protein [Clostridium pasteurianum]UZW14339.1 hypothetical protein OSC52_00260 [Clostridium pasteurianum]
MGINLIRSIQIILRLQLNLILQEQLANQIGVDTRCIDEDK